MERREKPEIDTVREVFQEEDERVREDPPSPEEDAGEEDEERSQ